MKYNQIFVLEITFKRCIRIGMKEYANYINEGNYIVTYTIVTCNLI